MKIIATGAAALLLAGCTTGGPRPTAAAPVNYGALPGASTAAGLDRVMGRDARAVTALLGQPSIDVQEGLGRKLQFGSLICVLDAYLYRPQGRGEPVVTYIDTRQRDGGPIDRASCVAALVRRDGGK
jgi:hypothetical protein